MLRGTAGVLFFTVLTILCWGLYGPVLHVGQHAMNGSRLLPFICVGLAYFLIAVIFPIAMLRTKGEKGSWAMGGLVWSFTAGAIGAIGALGIILAFNYRGNPVYVMPLVFGGAPVINTFVTMYMAKTFKDISPIFYAGLILVIAGAATVMLNKPSTQNRISIETTDDGKITVTAKKAEGGTVETTTANSLEELKTDPNKKKGYKQYQLAADKTFHEKIMIGLSIALTILCWGAYGPVLHKGQVKMEGSRLRPLICVGMAYFLIAVVVPLIFWAALEPNAAFTFSGSVWSLGAGAAGVLGAVGIIMAFNYGGKPILIMPLVFGGAPVVNTFSSIITKNTYSSMSPLFFSGLIVVIVGAMTVLIFAPKSHGKPPEKDKKKESPKDKPKTEVKPDKPQETLAGKATEEKNGSGDSSSSEKTSSTNPEKS